MGQKAMALTRSAYWENSQGMQVQTGGGCVSILKLCVNLWRIVILADSLLLILSRGERTFPKRAGW